MPKRGPDSHGNMPVVKIAKYDSFPEINLDPVTLTVTLRASFVLDSSDDIESVREVLARAKDELTSHGGIESESYEVDYGATRKRGK